MAVLPPGGSSHSEQSGGSVTRSNSTSSASSASQSHTYGTEATQAAINAATVAYERQKELAQMQMEFNAREAQKARDWETAMANSVYTRSVANMKEAGINPILAAGFGLSGASVGSGASASISGMNAPMANTFADQSASSASQSMGYGESEGSSWSHGFSDSMYGIESTIEQIGNIITGLIGAANSAGAVEKITETGKNLKGGVQAITKKIVNELPDMLKKPAKKVMKATDKKPSNAH